ncbi:MAG: bifunctional 5,10-methylenetetrahydrofolate dehydrogenase/5,10-methenyltetrahydrofolate cyclohydrolase [Candidatus Uhrbacteria bacterium]|nr:bifunctional 5,10-methylenetetrahydrofolate dehydrogenase/5,10-methenyltetrahydrofolate cyclohydrolase [Candidatus Uhrbacteria bacterium]
MIIDGKKIAEELRDEMKKKSCRLRIRPGFAAVLVGCDPSSVLYVQRKGQMAQELGLNFRKVQLPAGVSQKKLISTLDVLSGDTQIHGIILQVPLPPHIALDEVAHHIDFRKDIDCFHPDNLARLFLNKPTVVPPTPEAVLRLIQSVGQDLRSSDVVVIGDGFFARQISAHCLNQGAVVTLAHSKAARLSSLTRAADIVVTAVGRSRYLTGAMIKKGAVVIDVGITKNGKKVVGDVDLASVLKKARAVTPVPGGVGPLTVAVLMENVLKATRALTGRA